MDNKRLIGADFIRAMACLGVLVHHVVQRIDPNVIHGWARTARDAGMYGAFGVGGFFVLSGFLLARPFWQSLDRGDGMPSLKTYFVRRAARIMPAFYLALTFSFLVSFLFMGTTFDLGLVWRYVAGLLFISDFHWFTFFPVEFDAPLWSIGLEVSSYVLLPVGLAVLFLGNRFGLKGIFARAVGLRSLRWHFWCMCGS